MIKNVIIKNGYFNNKKHVTSFILIFKSDMLFYALKILKFREVNGECLQ
jgi:hypothetical protein